jgi:hypothetical protein
MLREGDVKICLITETQKLNTKLTQEISIVDNLPPPPSFFFVL